MDWSQLEGVYVEVSSFYADLYEDAERDAEREPADDPDAGGDSMAWEGGLSDAPNADA